MSKRSLSRALILALGLPRVELNRLLGTPPVTPKKVLIAADVVLGDTIMLAPLLAKVRARWPTAEITLTCPPRFVALFEGRPWGVRAQALDLRDPQTLLAARDTYDLALCPAQARHGWLAAALGARWIIGFAGDPRWHKRIALSQTRALPDRAMTFGDVAATLVDGPEPPAYAPRQWPHPAVGPQDPTSTRVVLHLGASGVNKLWPAENWRALIARLQGAGLAPCLVTGPGEAALLDEVDPERRLTQHPGSLSLPEYWQLLAGSRALVCPDTGIAHLGRIVGTPTVALFGPGSPLLGGAGHFWRESPYVAIWNADVACRDQHDFFERKVEWVRHCWRRPPECANPHCVRQHTVDAVLAALQTLAVMPQGTDSAAAASPQPSNRTPVSHD
ncbi:glycosyltransferase family 9 protein [Niveibacterium sp. 24ML]|uniref:glycosyltransferase family 9 protein n=1 Tax=Niveibacterium sp. 24ML TaxID=2985512 RepID=UPI00226D8386|nr:glycosyltransferase family 9 protein [Niveibacterium sp. 24ML]MCX9154706.1 glycosyltransferase family 9 protein [Niveibacterium sp. 24ML]